VDYVHGAGKMSEGPKETGNFEIISLVGKYFPYNPIGVLIIRMDGSDKEYLPIFSTEEDMHTILKALGRFDYESKVITDHHEFIRILQDRNDPHIRVMVDLKYNGGHCRYHEIDPLHLSYPSEVN
jgi:hypothetical protein